MNLTKQETATILAALREWQDNRMPAEVCHFPAWNAIATNCGEFKPISEEAIDVLCEKLTFDGVDDSKLRDSHAELFTALQNLTDEADLGEVDLEPEEMAKLEAGRQAVKNAEELRTTDGIEQMQPAELPIIPGLLRRHELEVGELYMPCDAKGEAISGSYEMTPGFYGITGIRLDCANAGPGQIDFEYSGDSENFAEDSQPEYNAKGEYQFITCDGKTLSESQLYYREVES